MKNLREDFKKLEVSQAKELLSTKIKLLCSDNNWKDLMVWLRERTTKLEPWAVKFKKPRRISDCPMPNKANLPTSWTNTNHNSKSATKSPKLTDKRFKNLWPRTIVWVTRWGTLNKTWDCQLPKLVSSIMSWRLLAMRLKRCKNSCKISAMSTRK